MNNNSQVSPNQPQNFSNLKVTRFAPFAALINLFLVVVSICFNVYNAYNYRSYYSYSASNVLMRAILAGSAILTFIISVYNFKLYIDEISMPQRKNSAAQVWTVVAMVVAFIAGLLFLGFSAIHFLVFVNGLAYVGIYIYADQKRQKVNPNSLTDPTMATPGNSPSVAPPTVSVQDITNYQKQSNVFYKICLVLIAFYVTCFLGFWLLLLESQNANSNWDPSSLGDVDGFALGVSVVGIVLLCQYLVTPACLVFFIMTTYRYFRVKPTNYLQQDPNLKRLMLKTILTSAIATVAPYVLTFLTAIMIAVILSTNAAPML